VYLLFNQIINNERVRLKLLSL